MGMGPLTNNIRVVALYAAAIFLLLTVVYTGTFPVQIALTRATNAANNLQQASAFSLACDQKLKVYMYDIPRKFNFGLLRRNSPDQHLPWTDKTIPSPPMNGLKKQHSVEYWMAVSLLDHPNGEAEAVAVRVTDPNEADVFFMPFFSSLSFNVYSGTNMRDPATEHDRQLQLEVLDFLRKSPWWQRSGGSDHILVLHHPNAFRFVRDELNASLLVVADFGRFPWWLARLSKDVVAPYSHMVPTYMNDDLSDPFEARSTLLFFQGRIKRKDDGLVRTKLAQVLENQSKVHFEEGIASNHSIEEAMKGMRTSKFCLHPAGDTPSSCRLFDAIVSHCVPVIVSDRIELPFEDNLDYSEFCVFMSMEEAVRAGHLLGLLNNFPKDRWLRMWEKLKEVTRHFEYQRPSKKADAISMLWQQIRSKVPSIKMNIHRRQRRRSAADGQYN